MSFKILRTQTVLGFWDCMTPAGLPTWTGIIRSGGGTADLEAVLLSEIDDHKLGVSQQGHGAAGEGRAVMISAVQPLGNTLRFQAFQEKRSLVGENEFWKVSELTSCVV